MIKQTLYGAVAAGALALAAAGTPAIAAPAAKAVPNVQSNVTDAQYYYYDGPRYRHRYHRHYRHYGYRHYEPGVGVYVSPGFGFRAYSY